MLDSITGLFPSSVRAVVRAMQDTSETIVKLQSNIATGKKINSPTEGASSFFASRMLNFEANDLFSLLDNLGQNKQVIKTAEKGLIGASKLLEVADALVAESKLTVTDTLSEQILADNPVAYWRLNETSGTTAVNLGSEGSAIDGTYLNSPAFGQTALYESGDVATDFNGSNQSVDIPDSNLINLTTVTQRTIELVFNADDINSRQVLYEEGATVNALSIYIDGGRIYVGGNDFNDWGPINISAPIVAGQTYNIALVLDQPNGEFRGYLDGELMGTQAITIPLSNHSGDIAIGRMRQGTWFYDGAQNGNGYNFNGRISDVAIHNKVISEADLKERIKGMSVTNETSMGEEIKSIFTQIEEIITDASYRGTNILLGDDIVSNFNMDSSSQLKTQGDDFTKKGLGLDNLEFSTKEEIDIAAAAIKGAMNKIRKYISTLSTNIGIISNRESFIANNIKNKEEGANKLTLTDMNATSAKVIATQTRRAIQAQVMSISFQGQLRIASMLVS